MWGGGRGGGGKGGSMPPLSQGFVDKVRKGWMPSPSDFANFGKEIYSVAETLSSCSFIACGIFLCQLLPKFDILRWLNRVMQNHEARASDLNRKLIFSFFLLFS